MRNSYFQFKKFTVHQDLCAMKVGTDGVLLGAWAPVEGCSSLLDVGTGTGLIALMLAQRCSAFSSALHIDAIDIDEGAARQARFNAEASPYKDVLTVHSASLQSFAAQTERRYDLIVSNPPYFEDSLKCPNTHRTTARHNDTLPLSALIEECCPLLAPGGHMAVILPFSHLQELQSLAVANGLYFTKTTYVIPVPGKMPKRILAALCNTPRREETDRLVIEIARHQYTPEYIALTSDFYLNM